VESSVGRKLIVQREAAALTDFERFKIMSARMKVRAEHGSGEVGVRRCARCCSAVGQRARSAVSVWCLNLLCLLLVHAMCRKARL